MEYELYSIYDQAAKTFLPPDYLKTDAEAIRKFAHNVNNKEMGFLYTNPEHYTLYHCGNYDDATGTFKTHEPVVIVKAVQVKSEDDAINQMKIAGT